MVDEWDKRIRVKQAQWREEKEKEKQRAAIDYCMEQIRELKRKGDEIAREIDEVTNKRDIDMSR